MGDYMSSAGNILKMLAGIVVLVIGIVWYTGMSGYLGYWKELVGLLKATIGLFLVFVGLIVAWMGYDDYKMDVEMAKEKKEEPKK
jgi:fumarate reductase subunit D